jgi:hypothetical protein
MKRVKAKYLMIMDSDGQCDFNEIIKFWKNRNNADIINGNRNPRKDFYIEDFIPSLR